MKKTMLSIIALAGILSACAGPKPNQYSDEQMVAICSDLNQKYADKTKSEMYYLKDQARQSVNYYFADNEKFDYYSKLYNEYKLAAECK